MTDINDDLTEIDSFKPNRAPIDFKVGNIVLHQNETYRISEILDFETIIGIKIDSGRSYPLRLKELKRIEQETDDNYEYLDLDEITSENWQIAKSRYEKIKPLLEMESPGRKKVEARAKEVGVHPSTLYAWLKKYKSFRVTAALIPYKRGWREGNLRISPEAEKIITASINEYYLTPERPTVSSTIEDIQIRCREKGIPSPSDATIRARIANISEKKRLKERGEIEKYKQKFTATPGSFPGANYPLSIVQIDHTPVDIELVDDEYRKAIGRPWITVAIDVYSRMITGYYLSFDAPSGTSVAMCLSHSILPKDEWLSLYNIKNPWPVWGKPQTIHVDNGPDFRADNLELSCTQHGIHIHFRKVKVPRYGGHIERLLGSIMKKTHNIPGSTFSSIQEKGEYKSETKAVFTKSEYEEWLLNLFTGYYHTRIHKGLGIPPNRKWEIGIFGNTEEDGIGIRPYPADRLSLQLDFLPAFRRTVQTFGVTIDGLKYYAEPLRTWINYTDPKTKTKKQLVFRRDPRDISSLWFFDPKLKQYFKIPFANLSLPPMSIWELREAKEKLKQEGIKHTNEHQILDTVILLRELVDKAKEKTKKARRQAQRRKEHEKNVSPAVPFTKKKRTNPPQDSFDELVDGDIDGFGDIA